MAGGKETPRQKMIGMMYLVLTALLAMNVSKEILNSFVIMNSGLLKTNDNFSAKNEVTYNAFRLAMLNDEVKTKKYFDAAEAARKQSSDMMKVIRQIKAELIHEVEKVPIEEADSMSLWRVGAKDNYDIPTHIMVGGDPSKPVGKAIELKKQINDFHDAMLALIPEKSRGNVNIGLTTEDVYSVAAEKMEPWEVNNFNHNPIAAVIAILTKLENDVKNAEGTVINQLLNEISAGDFKFDKLQARVIPKSSYVLVGETYEADVFVAAYNSTQNPTIYVGEVDTLGKIFGKVDSLKEFKDGMGKYIAEAVGEGPQVWSGLIKVKNPSAPNDPPRIFPFSSEYTVAKPAISVSPTKMNVFYIGVDNPVEVAAAGVSPDNLVVNGAGCSISGAKGKYTVRVNSGTECNISVSAKTKEGSKSMGAPVKFRIKSIPDPISKVNGMKGDNQPISKSQLTATAGVLAALENFDFDLKFDVLSFDVSLMIKGSFITEPCAGPAITPKVRTYLQAVGTGAKVYFENVKARGPDGKTRSIPGVSFKVK